MNNKILLLLAGILLCLPLHAQYRFSFHKDGKFKIAQFTDIHWTPRSANCSITASTIESVLQAEQPDIAILTGDVVTDSPALEGWKSIIQIFEKAQMPFAVLMGNHDAENMSKDSIYLLLSASPYFVGNRGPVDIKGYGNSIIPIYDSQKQSTISSLLYCFDSNDYPENKNYGHYDWIHFNQIDWYRRKSQAYTAQNNGKPLPALAFFHIATPEFNHLIGRKTTWGRCNEGGTGAPKLNSGMFTSFIECQDIMGVFVGHDHDNDFIGQEYGIALAYGRVTGDDAYGDFKRGGRIIELHEGTHSFDTWITTPDGKEFTYYYPSGITSIEEEEGDYLPARKVQSPKQGVAYTYYEGEFEKTAEVLKGKKVKTGVMKNFDITQAPAEDYFGYEFRTLILIPEKGIYNFYTYSDDGTKLYIDGKEIVDNDGSHNAQRAEGKVALEEGFHELRLVYLESYMGQKLEVGISGRNILETPIPDDMLYLGK